MGGPVGPLATHSHANLLAQYYKGSERRRRIHYLDGPKRVCALPMGTHDHVGLRAHGHTRGHTRSQTELSSAPSAILTLNQ